MHKNFSKYDIDLNFISSQTALPEQKIQRDAAIDADNTGSSPAETVWHVSDNELKRNVERLKKNSAVEVQRVSPDEAGAADDDFAVLSDNFFVEFEKFDKAQPAAAHSEKSLPVESLDEHFTESDPEIENLDSFSVIEETNAEDALLTTELETMGSETEALEDTTPDDVSIFGDSTLHSLFNPQEEPPAQVDSVDEGEMYSLSEGKVAGLELQDFEANPDHSVSPGRNEIDDALAAVIDDMGAMDNSSGDRQEIGFSTSSLDEENSDNDSALELENSLAAVIDKMESDGATDDQVVSDREPSFLSESAEKAGVKSAYDDLEQSAEKGGAASGFSGDKPYADEKIEQKRKPSSRFKPAQDPRPAPGPVGIKPTAPPRRPDVPFWRKIFKKKTSEVIIGVDFSRHSIKTIELEEKNGGLHLLGYENVLFNTVNESSEPEKRKDVLRRDSILNVFGDRFKKASKIRTRVKGIEAIYRVLELPQMGKKDLKEAVPWAMSKDIPYEVVRAAVEFVSLPADPSRPDKVLVSASAVPAAEVNWQLDLFGRMSITPEKISTPALALSNVINAHPDYRNKIVLALDIGVDSSNLVFMHQGLLVFHREITSACNEVLEAVSGTLSSLDFSLSAGKLRAAELVRKYGIPDTGDGADAGPAEVSMDELGNCVRQALDKLIREVERSIQYYKEQYSEAAIDHIVLSGGGALIKNIDTYFGSQLDAGVSILNPFEAAGITGWEGHEDVGSIAPKMAMAVGLAIDEKSSLNFIPEKYKRAARKQKQWKILRRAGYVLSVGVVAFSLFLVSQVKNLSSRSNFVQKKYSALNSVRKEHNRLLGEYNLLQKKEQIYLSKATINSNMALHLRAVSNLMTKNIAIQHIQIGEIPVASEKENKKQKGDRSKPVSSEVELIQIHGIVLPATGLEGALLATFLLKIENAGYFQFIEIESQELIEKGALRFTLNCFY